jgi:hypothetical protein
LTVEADLLRYGSARAQAGSPGSSHNQLIRFQTAVEKPLKAHEARRGKPRTSCCLLILDVRLDSTQIYNLSGFFLCPLYCTGGWLVQS